MGNRKGHQQNLTGWASRFLLTGDSRTLAYLGMVTDESGLCPQNVAINGAPN